MSKQNENEMMAEHKEAISQILGMDPSHLRAALDRFDVVINEVIADAKEDAIYQRWVAMTERFRKRFGRDPKGAAPPTRPD